MTWFYDLDLQKKLSLSFLAIGCATFLIVAVGFYGLNRVNTQNEAIYESRLVPLMKVSAAEDALGAIQVRIEHLAQDQLAEDDQGTSTTNIDSLEQEIARLKASFEQSFARAQGTTGQGQATEKTQRLVDKSKQAWEALRTRTEKLLRQTRNDALSVEQVDAFQEEARALDGALSELRAHQETLAEATKEQSGTVYRASALGLLVASGIGLGLAVLLAVGVSRLVSRPIGELEATAKRLAAGNLDARAEVETDDEIGSLATSFNNMARQIEDALNETEESRAQAKEAKQEAEELARQQKEEKQVLAEHVDTLLDAMKRFAEGDLTVRVDPDAEGDIGRLFRGFNEVVSTMGETIRQVQEAISTAGATAEQVSASAEQLAAGAQEQSTQAEEVAAAMEEMTRTIADNSEAVTETSDLARRNRKTARENSQIVLQTVNKMEEIGEAVGQSADQVGELHQASEEIGEIVETIDEIADQTNLLALNAAIEAARAGEGSSGQVGQGFAVVAEEVRELAGRSDAATDEIAEKIVRIQEKTREAVQAMEAGLEEVEAGIELAEKTQEAFEEIVEGADMISERVDEIAAATEEQSTTSEQVTGNVESISTVSQENARETHDIAQAIGELEEASGEARDLIEQFALEMGPGRSVGNAQPSSTRNAPPHSTGDGSNGQAVPPHQPGSMSNGTEA